MKILTLSESIIRPAVADRYLDNKTGKSYFNLSHGNQGNLLWRWYAGLSPKHFKDTDNENVVLDGNNYNIKPVYVKGSALSDKKGNICYNIMTDGDITHTKDIILLWGIPSRGYRDIEYMITGGVDVLGEGISGKPRGVNSITAPAPVLEITGPCTLSWTGFNYNDQKVTQVVTYDYSGEWDIGAININD